MICIGARALQRTCSAAVLCCLRIACVRSAGLSLHDLWLMFSAVHAQTGAKRLWCPPRNDVQHGHAHNGEQHRVDGRQGGCTCASCSSNFLNRCRRSLGTTGRSTSLSVSDMTASRPQTGAAAAAARPVRTEPVEMHLRAAERRSGAISDSMEMKSFLESFWLFRVRQCGRFTAHLQATSKLAIGAPRPLWLQRSERSRAQACVLHSISDLCVCLFVSKVSSARRRTATG